METYDTEKAARVWQRVQGKAETTPTVPGLQALIAQAWLAATTYLHLSRRFQGKESAALRRMAEEEQAQAACLRGIYAMTTGSRPTIRSVTPTQDGPEAVLRDCYSRERRRLAEFEKRSTDPEYGPVFDRMAQQARDHCRTLLELLGKLTSK